MLLALPLWTSAAAQEMYKCKDAAGKITYSSSACQGLGLTSAGEVSDRVTVQPAIRSSSQSGGGQSDLPAGAVQRRVGPATAAPGGSAQSGTAQAKQKADTAPPDPDADPNRRCFTVKTAKGTATRCNDTPPGAAGQAEGN